MTTTLDILLVEDDVFLQRIQSTIFQRLGHNVFTVGSGQAAIEFLSMYRVDLVVMDLVMPDMDGFETTDKIRSEGIKIPIFALSGNDTDEDRQSASMVGMDAYFTKPLSPEIVFEMLVTMKNLVSHGF